MFICQLPTEIQLRISDYVRSLGLSGTEILDEKVKDIIGLDPVIDGILEGNYA